MPTLSRSWARLAALLLVCTTAGVGVALAQTDVTTARIAGVVKDTEGGPLPGAMVEARNQETGFTMRTVAEATGAYRLLNLPVGLYTVSANLAGFTTASRADIRLALNQAPTIDFMLALAKVAESITVTAAVPLVEVTNTAASTPSRRSRSSSCPSRAATSPTWSTPCRKRPTRTSAATCRCRASAASTPA